MRKHKHCDTMIYNKIYKILVQISNKMACESSKCYSAAIYTTIMVVLSLQLLSTIERQVFDFLGYMWAPIIGNFFQIVCTILGIFGTYQYRPKFIAVYSAWSLIWLGWNVFVICLYLEVGVLNRNREIYILNIGTRNKSWWLEHGIGCKVNNDSWVEEIPTDTARKIPPEEYVEGCLLDYYYVEVIHAGVQCLLALTGFVCTCLAIHIYSEENESTTAVNDELEFVKMHTMTTPRSHNNNTIPPSGTVNPAADISITMEQDETEVQSTRSRATEYRNDYPTLDRPPSYETSMRNATAVSNNYYGADRRSTRSARSVRSVRSNRSKASTRSVRSKKHQERQERREELPWVQITPSASHSHMDQSPYRQFP